MLNSILFTPNSFIKRQKELFLQKYFMYDKKIEILKQFVTPERLKRFYDILQYRTKYATVVLEDIFQPHNASAVLRSCDLFGVQDVHIIENRNNYTINHDVAVGAFKWLNLNLYNELENNTFAALNHLKKQGYRIVATSPHKNDVELSNFNIKKGKFALVFGSEMPGISDIVKKNADEFLKINMYGFTESFNISVSAAIILHELIKKIHNSDINWQLSDKEYKQILLKWLKNTVKQADKVIKKTIK